MAFQRALSRAAGVAVLAGLALPAGALAAPSAYDQYVPLTPSAGGTTAPGGHGHGGGSGSVPLSRSAAARLQAVPAADRALLQAIGTSRDLGAPSLRPAGQGGGGSSSKQAGRPGSNVSGPGAKTGGHGATPASAVPPTSSSLSAAVHAIGHSPVLPVTLLAALAGAIFAGTLRRRRA